MLNIITPFLLVASLVAAAPAPQKRAVAIRDTCRVSGQVALTFDDGLFEYENDIVNALGDSKATFFLNGDNYACIYDHADELKRLHAAGMTLGNHGWSHKNFQTLSWDQAHDELWRVEEAFIKILGVKPLYFRPPYGAYDDNTLAVLQNRGYTDLFLWDQDTNDANGAPVWQSKQTIDGVASQFPNPSIVLSHSPLSSTAFDLAPYAINKLKGAGFKLVAVDTCLGDQGRWPYEYRGPPGVRDSTWHC